LRRYDTDRFARFYQLALAQIYAVALRADAFCGLARNRRADAYGLDACIHDGSHFVCAQKLRHNQDFHAHGHGYADARQNIAGEMGQIEIADFFE